MVKSIDLGSYFRIPSDNRDLNYSKYLESGNKDIDLKKPYTSHNTSQLDIESMKQLLKRIDLFKRMEI